MFEQLSETPLDGKPPPGDERLCIASVPTQKNAHSGSRESPDRVTSP
jgi:hypothetical protein